MKHHRAAILVTMLLVTGAMLPAPAQFAELRALSADRVDLTEDVVYGHAGERELKLDMAQPKQPVAERLPAVVGIHGGGWRAGEKGHMLPILMPLAASGRYVVFSIGYRLTDEARWPAQIHDCKAAIRWVRANADRLGVDPERIGVWGGSAGGHLAAMLGTTADLAELEGDGGSPEQSSRVRCVVSFAGPTDLRTIPEGLQPVVPDLLAALLGDVPARKPEVARSASPLLFVTEDDAPFLIVHGTEDDLVPFDQAQRLHEALQAAGVETALITVRDAGHGVFGPKIVDRTLKFLNRHLHGDEVEVTSATFRRDDM